MIPTNWYNRKDGVSKFKVKEMGSRYLFIVLYALIEKWLSRGDYRAKAPRSQPVCHSEGANAVERRRGTT